MTEARHDFGNREIRDDIRDYWSDRAATFDDDPGHKITEGAERAAWKALFTRHLGPAEGRALLDLASGTGEIALLCRDLGFRVTGLDWSEAMLDRAWAKAGETVDFVQADAERTTLPGESQDVVVTRHLVWTLVDPVAAFAEWFRVLRPGGTLLIVDGDFVRRPLVSRLLARLFGAAKRSGEMASRHADILARVHFSDGARAGAVADLLKRSGFTNIQIDTRLGAIHRAQRQSLGFRKSLLRRFDHRYAISAQKP